MPTTRRLSRDGERSRPRRPDQPHLPVDGLANRALARRLGREAAAPEVASDKTLDDDFEQIVSDAMLTMAMAAGGIGQAITIAGSVGRGGRNLRGDVAAVCARLLALGFNPGGKIADLDAAIERYQREVVGLRRPDGRIDPGGRTLTALSQSKRAPAPEPGEETAQAAPTPAAAPAPSGPRAPLADAALERLVSGNPAAEAAAAELAALESRFKGAKRERQRGDRPNP